MKRYYVLLLAFFVFVVAMGLMERRPPDPIQPARYIATLPPIASETRSNKVETEPFLYAIPLGTFTSYADATLYEWPGATAPVVGLLTGGKAVEYTSEYRHETEVWLCVRWEVNEEIASWKCTGWVLAEDGGVLLGTVDRSWEYTPDQALDKQAIRPWATKT